MSNSMLPKRCCVYLRPSSLHSRIDVSREPLSPPSDWLNAPRCWWESFGGTRRLDSRLEDWAKAGETSIVSAKAMTSFMMDTLRLIITNLYEDPSQRRVISFTGRGVFFGFGVAMSHEAADRKRTLGIAGLEIASAPLSPMPAARSRQLEENQVRARRKSALVTFVQHDNKFRIERFSTIEGSI
jgi:hypothetical protein